MDAAAAVSSINYWMELNNAIGEASQGSKIWQGDYVQIPQES